MPTINIPPKVRFALYLLGVVGAVFVQYAIDRSWFGDAELRLWTGLSAVLFMLAAAKTNTKTEGGLPEVVVTNGQSIGRAVGQEINKAARTGRDQRGEIGLLGICVVVLLVLVILFAAGVLR